MANALSQKDSLGWHPMSCEGMPLSFVESERSDSSAISPAAESSTAYSDVGHVNRWCCCQLFDGKLHASQEHPQYRIAIYHVAGALGGWDPCCGLARSRDSRCLS